MKSGVFSNAKFEKAKRFDSFRKIAKAFRFLQVSVVCALVLWSLTNIPTAVGISSECLLKLSAYLFNYHVVFLAGNAIILLIFILCRQNEVTRNHSAAGDLFPDYVKHSEVHQRLSSVPISITDNELIQLEMVIGEGGDDEDTEKKRIMCKDYDTNSVAKCDEVTMAIEKATKQIKRFQRIQSLRKPRCSETENLRRTPLVGTEIERLSNEEFQRIVQAFICKHRQFFSEQKLAESNFN